MLVNDCCVTDCVMRANPAVVSLKNPIEINGINVGTYRIAMIAEYAGGDTKDVQIRKGQTAVVRFW